MSRRRYLSGRTFIRGLHRRGCCRSEFQNESPACTITGGRSLLTAGRSGRWSHEPFVQPVPHRCCGMPACFTNCSCPKFHLPQAGTLSVIGIAPPARAPKESSDSASPDSKEAQKRGELYTSTNALRSLAIEAKKVLAFA